MAATSAASTGSGLPGGPNRSSEQIDHRSPFDNWKFGGLFLTTVLVGSGFAGFSLALAAVTKGKVLRAPAQKSNQQQLGGQSTDQEGGSFRLALRALGWGSLYAFAGVGTIAFIIWKVVGANSLAEFKRDVRQTVKPLLPPVAEGNPPGRTNFETLRELADYLSEKRHSTVSRDPSSSDNSVATAATGDGRVSN